MQRILVIVAGIVVLLGTGAVLYVSYFRNAGSIEVGDTPLPTLPGAAPTVTPGASEIVDVTTPVDVTPASASTPSRLAQISKGPVVPGMAIIALPSASNASSTDLVVRYMERQSGNVFHYNVRTGSITRTSNRTVPGVLSAQWSGDGSTAFVRYLSGADFSTINTYGLAANGTDGFFLSQNISDLAVSSTSILSLVSGVNGSVASVLNLDGTGAKNVFSTPLTSVRASFAGRQYLTFTKPSAALSGTAFLADATGRLTRIAGPLNGLVALASPSGTWLLISYVQNDRLQTRLIHTTTRESVALPLGTIADKCAWTSDDRLIYCGVPVNPPQGRAYPDDWYQGAVTFSDRIWKIDVSGRFAQLVVDFEESVGAPLDAEALILDTEGTALSFINRLDRSLWVFRL